MMRSLWIAKTGLEGQQTALDTIANNLANVQTTGYKQARPVFQDLIYQTLRQPGAQVHTGLDNLLLYIWRTMTGYFYYIFPGIGPWTFKK